MTSRATDGAAVTWGSGAGASLCATRAQAARPRVATTERLARSAPSRRDGEVDRDMGRVFVFMACPGSRGQRPLTIRQIDEARVLRIRHRGIGRPEQAALAQKEEAALVRTVESPEPRLAA
jgi:hypothetical protein